MFRWLRKLMTRLLKIQRGCPLYDELNRTCALERMEKIYQKKYHDEKPAWSNPAACFDEMD